MVISYFVDKEKRFEVVRLGYANSARIIIVLPPKGSPASYERFFQSFKDWDLEQDYELKEIEANLIMPKFNIESSFELREPLINLGLGTLFTSRADLSGMVASSDQLFVSSVQHKAKIEVDERGTKAAAATGVAVMRTSAMWTATIGINRPFAFFIKDQSGVVLFLGAVKKLKDNNVNSKQMELK